MHCLGSRVQPRGEIFCRLDRVACSSEALQPGDPLRVIGYENASGPGWDTNRTPISFESLVVPQIVFEGPQIAQGYSGGGLFDARFELLGMVVRSPGSNVEAELLSAIQGRFRQWRYPTNISEGAFGSNNARWWMIGGGAAGIAVCLLVICNDDDDVTIPAAPGAPTPKGPTDQ